MYSALRDQRAIARTVAGLAVVAVAHGHYVEGARLFGASERMQDAIGASPIAMRRRWYRPRLAEARTWLRASEFESSWAAGRALTTEDVIAEARSGGRRAASNEVSNARSGAGPCGKASLRARSRSFGYSWPGRQTGRSGSPYSSAGARPRGTSRRVFDKLGAEYAYGRGDGCHLDGPPGRSLVPAVGGASEYASNRPMAVLGNR